MVSLRKIGLQTVALAALVAGTPALAQDQQSADLIVTNAGKIHTGDDGQCDATAFAVRDGLFVEIGDDSEIGAYPGVDTQVIDADGRTVIPGLNGLHSHQIRGARFYDLDTRWDGMPTLEAALDLIRTEADRVPDIEFLDGGGAILRDEPNPSILYSTIGALPQMSEEALVNSIWQFYRELNRLGMTSAIDAGGGGHVFPEDYVGSPNIATNDGLPLRISYYLFAQDPGGEVAEFEVWIANNEVGENEGVDHDHSYELDDGGEFLVHSVGD